MTKTNSTTSPPWSRNTKLVITLVFVVILGALIIRFQSLLGPVIFSFFIAYLLHPVAKFLDNKVIHGWRASVSILYLLFVILLITLLTWGGLNLLQQVQSLIKLIQTNITQLPQLINDIFSKVYQIGPFTIDFTSMDLSALGQDILGAVQPLLGNLGNFVGSLATSAAGIFGWLAFILIVSYFILLESGGLRNRIIHVDFPGYTEDISRMRSSLGRIWNAFLRGQFIVFLLTVLTYSIVLPILGVRYAIGLALLGGTATFLPYIGPAVTWIAIGMATFFQVYKPWGLTPLAYSAIVTGIAIIIDQVFNNLVMPRILSKALKVHPAAVLISAVIAANLLGLIGLLVAAPLLATITLVGKYIARKMLDRDPWPEKDDMPNQEPVISLWQRIRLWWQSIKEKFNKNKAENKDEP
ncbi:MAG TPA: AI-2E family transporter [Anaerolineales bacterium]|nr:AI-2E family transporter [Anaerolineales bacterium]